MRKQKPPRFYTPIHPGKTRASPPRKNRGTFSISRCYSLSRAEQLGPPGPLRAGQSPLQGGIAPGRSPSATPLNLPLPFFPL
jgi:hypothetical protein